VDTNVLVYAHDRDAGDRHVQARQALEDLWASDLGVLSTQVLQELYVNVTGKIRSPISRLHAREIVEQYAAWPVHVVQPRDILSASHLQEQRSVSFWDALIVVAAQAMGAHVLLSEDLQTGEDIDGLRIQSPFA
jgi:predicted nucleic acid-binding protein